MDNYAVTEGQPSVEVCAVTSSTPPIGQSVSAQVSTVDGSATGENFTCVFFLHILG